MIVRIASDPSEWLRCFPVLSELRPHLQEDAFVGTMMRLAKTTQFQLAYLDDGGVRAVAGLRIAEWLHSGRYLEIEDLITAKGERSKGYGGILFDWIKQYAIDQNCNQLRLVSGIQREAAHRFYLRKGMVFEAKYFSMNLR
ncbi:MAG: GNAT family N-acetyltransferase [Pirellulales bacterium]